MEIWKPILFVAIMLAALGYAGWKFWQLVRRGWKDHLWMWREANGAAIFIAFVIGFQTLVFAIRDGIDGKVVAYAIIGVVGTAMPYLAYISGRWFGMWDRSRGRQMPPGTR